ncbi:MAG TPA: histidine--tRNA ligase [Limnochordia bacterium]
MELRAPRGTSDILPTEVGRWQRVEETVRHLFELYGYAEIRLPIFEHTEVFERGIGASTDVVEKEMYTFTDKAGRSLTLRPEGTAAVVRAFLEHKLYAGSLPFKVYYIGPMFRYERPQAGRQRQFYQLGAEALGSKDPALDAEMIAMPLALYQALGLRRFEVRLNSIGDAACRPRYQERLRAYYASHLDALCEHCRRRLDRNPMRLLDCKEPACQTLAAAAPSMEEDWCSDCRTHFAAVRQILAQLGIETTFDPRLVRGFDYYTKTVFEVICLDLGAQDALGGGGRYDGLVEAYGGPPTPAVGFALGMERLLLALARQGNAGTVKPGVDVFVASLGEGARSAALSVLFGLRRAGVRAESDHLARSLKAQMKAAARAGARATVILGDDELARGEAAVRWMADGEQTTVPLADLVAWLAGKLSTERTGPLGDGVMRR